METAPDGSPLRVVQAVHRGLDSGGPRDHAGSFVPPEDLAAMKERIQRLLYRIPIWFCKGYTAWELQVGGYVVRWVFLKGGYWVGGLGWLYLRRWSLEYDPDWKDY